MITRWDKIIVSAVCFFALAVHAFFSYFVFAEQAVSVRIDVDGMEYATYNLTEISGKKIVEIETEYGENTLEITSEGARMISASCSDKTDVKSGKITKPGQMIICAPNRVSVRITGKGKLNVDKVAY